jgi:hypothetical protein
LFKNEIRLRKFSFFHSESKFVWEGTLKIRSFVISINKLPFITKSLNKSTVLFNGEIRRTKLNKIVIPIHNPKGEVKIRGFVQEISS